ncbi:MAG: hslR [Rhizobacter sp.]|nr:hslR [Rhizobacter sp.]
MTKETTRDHSKGTARDGGKESAKSGVRLDKWLWAARFYKTRSLATDEIDKGRIHVNEQSAKPSRDIRVGDTIELRQGAVVRSVRVTGVSDMRGPAPVAQLLYEETPESVAAREQAFRDRKLIADPALAFEDGRPTKKDRRELAEWHRWSASVDGS